MPVKKTASKARAMSSKSNNANVSVLRRFARLRHAKLVAFVLVFAGISSAVLGYSHAATTAPSGMIVGIGSKCVDVKYNQHFDGNTVWLYHCDGNVAQQWSMLSNGTIQNQGWCMDVANGAKTAQALVQLRTCNGAASQRWTPQNNGTLLNLNSGLCLDDQYARTDDMNPLWIWPCDGNVAQRWTVPQAAAPVVVTPAVPSGLRASAAAGAVSLSWSASANAAKYNVYRNGAVVATVAAGLAYTDSGLIANTAYGYQVQAVSAAGQLSLLSPTVTATTPATFHIGVVGWPDNTGMTWVQGLGTKLVRAEFSATPNDKSAFEAALTLAAAHHLTLQPLIGWDNGTAAPDLTYLGSWAKAYGPGGSFWAGKTDVYPVYNFELGNENSYTYKSGDVSHALYSNLATAYGQRAVAAARSINTANPKVGVLVELADGDTRQNTWINAVLAAGGPDLVKLMHGPVMHLYGPDWQARLDACVTWLQTKGVTAPYYITEWGIATDNGLPLTDNYGYPVNMTYDQTAAEWKKVTNAMAAEPTKLQEMMVYTGADNRDHGESNDREHYFGILQSGGVAKGNLTTTAKAQIAAHQ